MLDYLRSFAYIEAIERTGSIRTAAKTLHITASALDRRLQDLEQALGVPIFERHSRGMRVSPAGEIFLHHMRAHRADSERMRQEIDRLRGLRSGRVRIAASQAAASHMLPAAIRRFQAHHPDIRFDVRVSTHAVLVDLLRRFEADIALIYGPPAQEDLTTLLEIPQELYALMRTGHPLSERPTLNVDDCLRYPLALPGATLALGKILGAEFALQAIRPTIALESDSLELLRHYVRDTDAITFQITAGVNDRDDAWHGLIACRAIPKARATPPLCVMQLRGRTLPHAAAAFAENIGDASMQRQDHRSVPLTECRD